MEIKKPGKPKPKKVFKNIKKPKKIPNNSGNLGKLFFWKKVQ